MELAGTYGIPPEYLARIPLELQTDETAVAQSAGHFLSSLPEDAVPGRSYTNGVIIGSCGCLPDRNHPNTGKCDLGYAYSITTGSEEGARQVCESQKTAHS